MSETISAIIHPANRVREYLRTLRLLIGETRDQVHATGSELSSQIAGLETYAREQAAEISAIRAAVAQVVEDRDAAVSARQDDHEQLVEILRFLHDRGQWRRERLRDLRASDAYLDAFTDPNPLVSIVIPTYDNYDLLRERAIPSVLAQTYQNFEIVIVGDAAPEPARIAVEGFGDPRITFFNLPFRGPYPIDADKRWLVAGVPPYNEAVARASGLWIAPLDDDDAFRPQHIESLLDHARANRLELAYGQLYAHLLGGETAIVGRFPPELGQFGLQAALYHAGLAEIFELELADASLGLPYDWAVCLRMLETGVRVGMLAQETTDYYPSRLWTPRSEQSSGHEGPGSVDSQGSDDRPADDAPEWEYVPDGWDRARRTGEASALGWHADEVARAYSEKWPRFLEAVAGPGPLGVGHEVPTGASIDRYDVFQQNAVLAFAYALARASVGSDALSVLDWGGALAHYYVMARHLLPELQLDYHCRELPSVCAEGRRLLPAVTFHEDDGCFDRRYDLVMASNSLQYEEDWPRLLRRLAECSEVWTFLTRVPVVGQHASFVVLQRAYDYGYATEYLGWVLNRDELLEAAHGTGLELEREFALLSGFPVTGAPSQVSHAGFLFRTRRSA